VLNSNSVTAHKYDRGHVLIFGGAEMTGAARLAARGARRIGAGLVTLSVPESSLDVYRSGDPGNIVEKYDDTASALSDPRRNAVVVGPGLGVSQATLEIARTAIASTKKTTVLDADALSALEGHAGTLSEVMKGPTVLTPHEGEFARLFDTEGDKLSRAKTTSAEIGAIIVLKGADTVIASPNGQAAINASAPPWLGTAGQGMYSQG
jgi:hydroxyethylthiazole kinase-like uncharacterized protein yjeF